MPVTKGDIKMAKKHVKATVKLEKKKAKDHIKAAKATKNSKSKAYNLAHAKGHLKDVKDRMKYVKKVTKIKAK